MKKPTLNIKSGGFSLVELLVVIAVIAIIAAIAIPNIANITGAADTAKAQRNAQNIASVASAARAAGWDAITDLTAAVNTITGETGVVISGGAFDGQSFGVPGLSAEEIAQAMPYLSLAGGNIIYTAGGTAEAPPQASPTP